MDALLDTYEYTESRECFDEIYVMHLHVWRDIYGRIHIYDVTHMDAECDTYECTESRECFDETGASCDAFTYIMWHIWMHSHIRCDAYGCTMWHIWMQSHIWMHSHIWCDTYGCSIMWHIWMHDDIYDVTHICMHDDAYMMWHTYECTMTHTHKHTHTHTHTHTNTHTHTTYECMMSHMNAQIAECFDEALWHREEYKAVLDHCSGNDSQKSACTRCRWRSVYTSCYSDRVSSVI